MSYQQSNFVKENRIGLVTASFHLMETEPDIVMGILGQTLVVGADVDYATKTITYQTFSPYFDPVTPGEFIPKYTAYVTQDDMEIVRFSFNKQPETNYGQKLNEDSIYVQLSKKETDKN